MSTETSTVTKVFTAIRNMILRHRRDLEGPYLWAASTVGALLAIFYFYTSYFGIFSIESHRAVFFGITLALVFLWFPATDKSPTNRFTILDVLLALATIIVSGYFMVTYSEFVTRPGVLFPYEIWMGWVAIALSLEGARRAVGILLPVISFLAILYCIQPVAQTLPEIIAHRGMSYVRISGFLFTTADGIFGVVTNTMATYVLPFVIFGAFLQKSGAGNFFIELPYALLGRTRSGSALVAVGGSAMLGSIVGSPLANVVATGNFTIPLMKKSKYHPDDAGAIEAAVSSGSMFMPPVMGAAIFLMVEFTGIPYLEILKVALVPALLFFFGVGIMVHLYALKTGIKGMPKEELPDAWQVLKRGWFFVLPLAVLLYVIILGFTPARAAFFGSLTCLVVCYFRKDCRMGPRDLWEVFVIASRNVLTIAAVSGAVGIIVGVLTLTGLGLKFSSVVVALAGGNLFFTIVLVAIAATFLGMGTNIAAVYAILAVIAPAALIEMGASLVAAHMLLVWYSQLSGITPPVCLVAYAASTIAQGHPFRTGVKSLKYGIYLLVLPLAFIYTPLLLEGTAAENTIAILTVTLAVFGLAVFMQRFFVKKLAVYESLIILAGVVMLFTIIYILNVVGIGLLALGLAMNYIRSRRMTPMQA